MRRRLLFEFELQSGLWNRRWGGNKSSLRLRASHRGDGPRRPSLPPQLRHLRPGLVPFALCGQRRTVSVRKLHKACANSRGKVRTRAGQLLLHLLRRHASWLVAAVPAEKGEARKDAQGRAHVNLLVDHVQLLLVPLHIWHAAEARGRRVRGRGWGVRPAAASSSRAPRRLRRLPWRRQRQRRWPRPPAPRHGRARRSAALCRLAAPRCHP